MRRFSVCCLVSLFIFIPVSFVFTQTRGELELIASNGEIVGKFSQGYALVIGEINYNPDWDQLKSIENDIVIVKNLLEEQNFIVETLKDKTSDELKRGIENFLNTYGVDENARLVVFFAGHGATHPIQGRDIGYIVPIDAPTYKNNQREFIRKAIPIEDFQHWANRLPCRHILFIFDSCFSGTIFTTRSAADEPLDISYSMAKPVRQFITTGDEKEKVPAESKMIPLLERALRDGEADRNEDGYTTGTELGMYLQSEIIIRHQGQWHPQYGKSHDTRWDKGDFVFKVGKRNVPRPPVTPGSVSGSQSSVAVGSVTVESDIAGEIIIDGKPSGTIKAGGTVTITNVSTGNTEVAVKESDGTVIKAPIQFVRQGQTVTAVIERPVPEGLIYEFFDGKSVTITKYLGNASVLYIPGRIQGLPVTVIGDYAFNSCYSLTSVIIPPSVTVIGNIAFNACSKLASVTIPSSVTTIGYSVFQSCDSLADVTIPSSVTTIGDFAFRNCRSLINITVDSRNPEYSSVDGVLFDKNIKTVIKYPEGKKTEVYSIPSSVTTIGDSAFYHSSLTSLTIPYSVTTIGHHAFLSCNNLISVSIPSSVITIGDSVFDYCNSLTSITIPYSVRTISYKAFNNCGSLTSITVDGRNPEYSSVDGVLFDKNIKTIIRYPEGKKTETYTIPSSVATIRNSAFYSCSSLTNIIIPSSVTTIDDEAFLCCGSLTNITIPSSVTAIGKSAFDICDKLENIIVDSRNTVYTSIDGVLFDKNIKTIIKYPEGKTEAYSIPSSVITINDYAFCYSKLTGITIPSSVTTIGDSAFNSCQNLTSVTIPSSVTTIGRGAFWNCFNLDSIIMSRRTQVYERGESFRDTIKIIYRD